MYSREAIRAKSQMENSRPFSEMQLPLPLPLQTVTHYVFGSTRNVLAGAGLCYALENKKYLELPLVILFPSIYAGYNVYSNRDGVAQWIRKIF